MWFFKLKEDTGCNKEMEFSLNPSFAYNFRKAIPQETSPQELGLTNRQKKNKIRKSELGRKVGNACVRAKVKLDM